MNKSTLLKEISDKESDKEKVTAKIIENPALLSEVFEGLNSDKANVKYGCEKVLRIISEIKPEVLINKVDFFIKNLDSENNFFKWGAIHVLANLAVADQDKKIDSILDKYFSPIPGPVLVTAANVITGAAKIARAKPQLSERITHELLKVEKASYQSDECRNIALGKAIESFDQFFDLIEDKAPVIRFIEKQLENTRNATRKKAEKFMKKHSRIS